VAVVPFRSLGLEDVERAGGKAAHLGDLLRAGFPVPDGFAITTEAFDAVVGARREVEPEDVAALELPPGLADEIRAGYAQLGAGEPPVAVRSSAVAEDAADASFAGMQSTYLYVRGGEAVLAAVRRCWGSYFNAEALSYRARHGGAAGMSVAVQRMVDARVAGVLFTLNPVSGDRSSIAIEASYGLGASVVGGEVTPDSFLYSKVTREPLRVQLGTKEMECVQAEEGGTTMRPVPEELRSRPCLQDAELLQLVELGRDVERHYGRPQDLEWAIERASGALYLLQARPETVWTPRRVARERGGPAAHVAALYLDSHRAKP
jgi:pyruvate,water dikinase